MGSVHGPSSPQTISVAQARPKTFLTGYIRYTQVIRRLAMEPLAGPTAMKVAICDAVGVAIRPPKNEHALFSLLASDVVHSIFEIVLDLNKIHDPYFPLDQLDLHRRQLFQMRRVCTTWNNFLLSSPRYWRVINIKSPLAVISACLERSGSTTLCIYCTQDYPGPAISIELVPEELQSSVTRVQTLRSDDPDAYQLCRWLVRTRTPALQTLGLLGWGFVYSQEKKIEPLGDLSPIHHLTAASWTPLSDALWLAGLKELILTNLIELDAEVFQILSACTSLERLRIQCSDLFATNVFPGVPDSITLPCIQAMDVTFYSHKSVVNLIRRLVIPRGLRGSLEIEDAAPRLNFGGSITDYCNFMSPEERSSEYPESVDIRIERRFPGSTHLVCETGNRRVALELPHIRETALGFHDFVQKFQARLQGPPLTITIVHPVFSDSTFFLKALNDQNVRTIVGHFQHNSVDFLLTAIGVPSTAGEPLASITTDWPFESLKSIVIHGAQLNVSRITRLVGIRWKYLREHSKTWVEEIVLVDCQLRGMRLGKGVKQLAAIGVTLRGIGCSRF